ncbi:MAG: Fur family transcriptional regulator [Anaerolineales bacterium]|jgi:Fur family ferric uptake transcriptional regulator
MPHCQTYLDILRQRGYRITPQREMIIEAAAHSGRHMTAEEIFAAVRERTQTINLATIYRTLDMLVEEGLVTRNNLGGEKSFYATELHGPHTHLVCRGCDQILDADYELLAPLNEQLQQKYGFLADLEHLSIPGVCRECQLKQS